jgi:hypothetical protein
LARNLVGHRHFWDRGLSRRQFIATAAAASGAAVTSSLWFPELVAAAGTGAPNPIPGGIAPFGPGGPTFHIFLPSMVIAGGHDPNTITDFRGVLALAETKGTGVGGVGSAKTTFNWEADVRLIKGVFVGQDRKHHHGAFAFV